jgi:hypothetical protein
VLYKVDVHDILSIGDPASTKHSVVAVGEKCKAAGIAQLEIDDRTDVYKSMKDYERKGVEIRQRIADKGDPKGDLVANAEYYEKQVADLGVQLNGYVPPPVASKTIMIDFDSGHYAPNQAWKEAMTAWAAAGYTAKWSTISRRV